MVDILKPYFLDHLRTRGVIPPSKSAPSDKIEKIVCNRTCALFMLWILFSPHRYIASPKIFFYCVRLFSWWALKPTNLWLNVLKTWD